MTLVASALAGGDCIDDADALRAGGTVGVLGCVVKAPSTLGTFLRSFRWGHVRQLDRVSRQLLARAWAAGAGPGDSPLTIDLDSTICETYGLAKEGARHHGYTGKRGYHPLLAIAAGTGDVLMSRLREGRANTARGAAHFLRETVGRVRYAGANGRLTLRADSGFYTHGVVSVCREMDVRFSITIRQHKSLRNLIEAIPDADWTPVPYWMDGAADVAQTTYTPFRTEPGAALVRLIVRRVKPHARFPIGPLRHLQLSRLHHRPGRRDPGTGGRPPPPRRDRERHSRPQVRRRAEPHAVRPLRRQRRLAGGTGDGPQPGPLDGADWSGRADRDHQDPSATVLLPGRTAHPLGTPPHPASATAAGLGKPSSVAPWHGCERFHSQPDGARPQLTRHPPNRTSPQSRASPVREHLSPRPLPAISPYPTSPDGHKVSPRRLKTDTGPIYPNRARTIASLCPSSPILLL